MVQLALKSTGAFIEGKLGVAYCIKSKDNCWILASTKINDDCKILARTESKDDCWMLARTDGKDDCWPASKAKTTAGKNVIKWRKSEESLKKKLFLTENLMGSV